MTNQDELNNDFNDNISLGERMAIRAIQEEKARKAIDPWNVNNDSKSNSNTEKIHKDLYDFEDDVSLGERIAILRQQEIEAINAFDPWNV